MSHDIPLERGDDAFPSHVYHALGGLGYPLEDRIGGAVMVIEKRPDGGPITMMTGGVSRLQTATGESVELAVECLEGQQGAALVALRIVCDDIAMKHRVPPVGVPWRNPQPFLNGTAISAIVVTGSRWGTDFDKVRNEAGAVVGHVRTLRLLTAAEAEVVAANGWEELVRQVGTLDALLDVTRGDAGPQVDTGALTATQVAHFQGVPVIVSKLHDRNPPRWLTYVDRPAVGFQSVTGMETPEYMQEPTNFEIWSFSRFLERFPFVSGFVAVAQFGESGFFPDQSGNFTIEVD